MGEKILTLHPRGKKGVNISKEKYSAMRASIVKCLRRAPSLTHSELVKAVRDDLEGRFSGSIPWYLETVKLDLEARGVIERYGGRGAEAYRLRPK